MRSTADAGSGADATARTAADAAVQQIQNDVHAAQALLSVATLPSIDLHIKQLSLIIMKRAIEVHYSADSTMFQQPVIPTAGTLQIFCAIALTAHEFHVCMRFVCFIPMLWRWV